MRRARAVAIAVTAAALIGAASACTATASNADSVSARQSGNSTAASNDSAGAEMLRAYVAAAERGDPQAMLSLYASRPDISWVTEGDLLRGRDAIRADLDSTAGPDARFQVTAGTADVQRVGDGALLVVAPVTISAQTDTGPARIRGALTLVLEREGSAWKILHNHFSFPQLRR